MANLSADDVEMRDASSNTQSTATQSDDESCHPSPPTPCPHLRQKINSTFNIISSSGVRVESQSQSHPSQSQSSVADGDSLSSLSLSQKSVSSRSSTGTADFLTIKTSAMDLEASSDNATASFASNSGSVVTPIAPKSSSTQAKRPFVQRDLEQGYGLREIAERHNISYKIVRRWRIEQQRLTMQMHFSAMQHARKWHADYTTKNGHGRKRQRQFLWSSDEDCQPHPEVMKKVCKMLLSSSESNL